MLLVTSASTSLNQNSTSEETLIFLGKLQNQNKGKGDEIHITDSIRKLIKDGEKFIAHTFKGKYLDCGTMSGYIKSSIEISYT